MFNVRSIHKESKEDKTHLFEVGVFGVVVFGLYISSKPIYDSVEFSIQIASLLFRFAITEMRNWRELTRWVWGK